MSDTALTTRESHIPALEMELSVEQVVAQTDKILKLVKLGMSEGTHYGKIPGTPKPTLFQAGAEKLCLMFRLAPRYSTPNITRHGKHMTVVTNCELIHIPTGNVWSSASGLCTTEESKYAYRKSDRICPDCGKAAIRKDTKEGGYYCWRKLDGCGAQFKTQGAIATIESQAVGRVENEDVADQFNTAIKMAEKRAFVSSVKSALAVSDTFTVDIEDLEENLRHVGASPTDERSDIGAPPPPSQPKPTDKASPQQRIALQEAAEKALGKAQGNDWLSNRVKEPDLNYTKRGDMTVAGYRQLMKEVVELARTEPTQEPPAEFADDARDVPFDEATQAASKEA